MRVIQAAHQAHYAIKTYAASRLARSSTPPPAQEAHNDAAKFEEVGIDHMIYRAPEDPVWHDAWRVTEELIVVMRDEVESKGAKFLAVTLSNGIQVHPDGAARQQFGKRLGVDDFFYPDLRIKALGEREGFAVLNLAPALRAYAERDRVFLHGFGRDLGNGHWNEVGHRVAGEMIAQQLCEGILEPASLK